jgi:hypothetical protein
VGATRTPLCHWMPQQFILAKSGFEFHRLPMPTRVRAGCIEVLHRTHPRHCYWAECSALVPLTVTELRVLHSRASSMCSGDELASAMLPRWGRLEGYSRDTQPGTDIPSSPSILTGPSNVPAPLTPLPIRVVTPKLVYNLCDSAPRCPASRPRYGASQNSGDRGYRCTTRLQPTRCHRDN